MPDTATLIAQYGFACVALVIFLGEIGLPILLPGELALLLAGSQLIHSRTGLIVACLVLAAVDLVATTILHVMARSGGNRLLRMVMRRMLKENKRPEQVLDGWRSRLGAHDSLLIFLVRCVPGIRISASVVPGVLRLPLEHFLLGAVPASLLWVSVPLILGYALRDQVGALQAGGAHLLLAVGVAVICIGLIAGGRWWIRRQRAAETARTAA